MAAVAGLLCAVLWGFAIQVRQNAASDFKTLYASAWCFARGIDAYRFASVAKVFAANYVVAPRSWYAHAPVYPPFTLALLAPLTLLPMVQAVYVWMVLTATAMAISLVALTRIAGKDFHLGVPWRILLIALSALSPLLSAGLELGNVSVMVAALCILAVAASEEVQWLPAIYLILALLLKPHIAVWVLVPLLFSKCLHDRAVALRACGVCAVIIGGIVLWASAQHQATAQLTSYREMVASELTAGSMAPNNRALMEVTTQITSLGSLLAFWLPEGLSRQISECILASMAAALVWASWRLRAADARIRLELIATWSVFGMIATYHRAHDGTVLLLLLVPVLARIHRWYKDGLAWCVLILLASLSFGPDQKTLHMLASRPAANPALQALLYRQAAVAAFLLATLLLAVTLRAASREVRVRELYRRPHTS